VNARGYWDWVIGAGSTLISVGAEVCESSVSSEVVKVRRGQVNGRVIIV